MSGRGGNIVEWVEAEEVIPSEPPSDMNPSAVVPELDPTPNPIQDLLEAMVVQEDDLSFHDGFYCEECQALYQDQSDFHGVGGPSFILDSPTPMGALQRALLTLPHGLMIGRSSIPGAGLGVVNQGPTLSPGMHFGPFEGEVTTRESAVESAYSWEVCKEKDEYEYIDGARDTHSNWMRYVNCARNEEERNLLVVQYREKVLFHCCRSIHQGDELMVWPSKTYLSQISEAWNEIWLKKCTPTVLENNLVMATQIFPCSQCHLPFTTESYLLRHTEHFHSPPQEDCSTPGFEAVEPGSPPPNSQQGPPSAALEKADTEEDEEDKKCPECGKIFKHSHHLKRHKFNVHSNKRPYCCAQCRRCFSQACGLLRHQLVHKKTEGAAVEEAVDSTAVSQTSESEIPPPDDATDESPATPTEEAGDEPDDLSHKCLACEREFTNQYHLKRHMLSVHSNSRPYGCTQCKKCFGQSSDLARHLKVHQRRKRQAEMESTTTDKFHCTNCSLSFFEGESLQLHMTLHHSEEAAGEEDPEELGGESLSPSDVNQDDQDPNFVAPPSVTKAAGVSPRPLSQRLQRAGARSKMSAITRLLAPKRRAVPLKKEGPRVETSNGEGVPEHDDPSELTAGDAKSGKYKWFSCGDCRGTYGNPDDLKAHECTEAKGQHSCPKCDATFKRLVSLRRHERAAHGRGTSHGCDRCGKVYKKATGLQRHREGKGCEKIHTAELFPCAHCQFSFTMKSYLHKHVKRHHPVEYVALMESGTELVLTRGQDTEEGEGHTCPHCGKRYVNAKRFKAHKCFSQMEILYLCTDCGKGFANHYGLKQHQRIHTGEKPYTCPHCTKSFHYVGQLNVHLRTHTGEKPYLCTHCGESFRQSGDLKRHERKHTGVRPHKCPKCDKCFSRPQSLKAHQMLHQGQRMFKCTQCGKSFSRNYHLRRHHVKMHS